MIGLDTPCDLMPNGQSGTDPALAQPLKIDLKRRAAAGADMKPQTTEASGIPVDSELVKAEKALRMPSPEVAIAVVLDLSREALEAGIAEAPDGDMAQCAEIVFEILEFGLYRMIGRASLGPSLNRWTGIDMGLITKVLAGVLELDDSPTTEQVRRRLLTISVIDISCAFNKAVALIARHLALSHFVLSWAVEAPDGFFTDALKGKVTLIGPVRQDGIHPKRVRITTPSVAIQPVEAAVVSLPRPDHDIADTLMPVQRALEQSQAEVMRLNAEVDRLLSSQDCNEMSRLRAELWQYKQRVMALEQAALAQAPLPSGAARRDPASWDDIEQYVAQELSGLVTLTSRAMRDARASSYRDFAFVQQVLEWLGHEYVPMRRGEPGARERCKQAEAALCIEACLTGMAVIAAKTRDTYRVVHRGRTLELDMHVKRGNSRDGREHFRLYFAYVEFPGELGQVVVGSFPSHLDNRLS